MKVDCSLEQWILELTELKRPAKLAEDLQGESKKTPFCFS